MTTATTEAPQASTGGATLQISATTIVLQPGERYAGATLNPDGSVRHHCVLLPDRPDRRMNWDDSRAWATSVHGSLPSPQEQALLFANVRDALPETWCWSDKEDEDDASYAWGCYFTYGHQLDFHKSVEGSAVALRRLIP